MYKRLTSNLGSSALKVLLWEEASFEPNDLDLYAPHTSAAELHKHLVDVQGFICQGLVSGYYNVGMEAIHSVERYTRGSAKVDVILSRDHPLRPVAGFWCTTVMNAVSARGVLCFYPRYTLKKQGIINHLAVPHLAMDGDAPVAAVEKYRSRGFDIRRDHTDWDETASKGCGVTESSCPSKVRYMGDKHCLWISFESSPDVVVRPASGGDDFFGPYATTGNGSEHQY